MADRRIDGGADPLPGVSRGRGPVEGVASAGGPLLLGPAGAKLAYADLRGADLSGTDLRRADLRWADLEGATLRWADLQGALLEGTRVDVVDARFASIDPRHADQPALAGAIVGGFLDDDQIGEVRRTFELVADGGTAVV